MAGATDTTVIGELQRLVTMVASVAVGKDAEKEKEKENIAINR